MEHARALAERFEQLPPVLVHRESMTVIDGAHRLLAARILHLPSLKVEYFDGTATEALVQAVRANVTHGKPLNLYDRERAAEGLLSREPNWSDRLIAEICGLSPTTVGRIRVRSRAKSSGHRIGRDGRMRPGTARRSNPLPAEQERLPSPPVTGATRREQARSQGIGLTEPDSSRPEQGCEDPTVAGRWFERNARAVMSAGEVVDSITREDATHYAAEARRISSLWSAIAADLEQR